MNRRYAEVSATLRELADRLAAIADHPALDGAPDPQLYLSVLPAPAGDPGDVHQALVDVIAAALAGNTRTQESRQPCSRGGEIYARRADLGQVRLEVQAVVPGPQEDLRAEVARLRAELAAAATLRDEAGWLARRAAHAGAADDLRDHAEEHAVARDYVAEYGPELDAEAGEPR